MSTKGNIINSIFYNCSNLLETYLSTHKVEDDDAVGNDARCTHSKCASSVLNR